MSDAGRFLPRRVRTRLSRCAYEEGGLYFVTICTEGRRLLFGHVEDCRMRPNAAGRMVEDIWRGMPSAHPTVRLDAFQIMPNHLHALVAMEPSNVEQPFVLADLLERFKSLTTRRYADGVESHGWPAFALRLWQRGYHDHTVRSDRSLERIRSYIEANPARWDYDRENPGAVEPTDA